MTTVLKYSANEIIEDAFLDSGIIPPDQVPEAEDVATGFRILNRLLKLWQVNMHLWLQEEAVIFLNQGQQSYFLGPDDDGNDGDEACDFDQFISTTTTLALVATDTTITVVSTAGMASPPELITINPLDSQFWTTTNSTLVEGTNLTLENDGAFAGFADFSLTCEVGSTYRILAGYIPGTSVSATFSVRDPVDDVEIVTSGSISTTQTVQLEFTATQETMTFRFSNDSTTDDQTSLLSSLSQIDKVGGDRIGIRLDDGTRFWDTIVTIIDATSLEINNGIPSSAASGLSVFTYTEKIDRPLRTYNGRTQTFGDDNEIPVEDWSRQEYMQQPLKSSQGIVVNQYYTPELTQGRLYVWQTAADVDQLLLFTYDKPFEVTPDTAAQPDIPVEWANPLKWAIAKEMIPGYGVPQDKAAEIRANAVESLKEARDNSNSSVYDLLVSPDMGRY